MITETHHINVGRIKVEVVRKDIKNLHLGVYPPHGRVRIAAPLVSSRSPRLPLSLTVRMETWIGSVEFMSVVGGW